jgi:hypothetical protein
MDNVVRLHKSGLTAVDFDRGQAIDKQPHRLRKLDTGWVLVADAQMPGTFEPGEELLDLRHATSECEAVLAALKWCYDNCRDGPDPELGDAIMTAVAEVERHPKNVLPLRRLTRLLSPGISEFHEDHRELSVIFGCVRYGGELTERELEALIATARSEASFLITGRV